MLRLASSGFCRQRHQRPLRRSLASAASALALLADFWVKDFGTLGALIRDAFLWMHSNTFQWDVSTLAISFCLFHSASTVFPLGRRTCSTSVCSQPAECWFQAQLGNRLKLIADARLESCSTINIFEVAPLPFMLLVNSSQDGKLLYTNRKKHGHSFSESKMPFRMVAKWFRRKDSLLVCLSLFVNFKKCLLGIPTDKGSCGIRADLE